MNARAHGLVAGGLAVAALVAGGAVQAQPSVVTNDPQVSSQWYLTRIRAPQAWALTQGAADVVIAIVDSGVDAHHPEFAGKLVAGANTHDRSGVTADQQGHGTQMAGVAAARTHNGVGIAGVAGQSSVMPMRATDRKGRATAASIAKAITWATDHGARVVNVSLEGITKNSEILAAAQYAFEHGTLVVAPSGNCGCEDLTPETPFILSVGATDEDDRVATFSGTGPSVDLAAPGTNITTTAMYGLYVSDTGTSVASSVVAGVAALMFAANPALSPSTVTRLLEETAVGGRTGAGRDHGIGHGRVDAFAAVSAAKSLVAAESAGRSANDSAPTRLGGIAPMGMSR